VEKREAMKIKIERNENLVKKIRTEDVVLLIREGSGIKLHRKITGQEIIYHWMKEIKLWM